MNNNNNNRGTIFAVTVFFIGNYQGQERDIKKARYFITITQEGEDVLQQYLGQNVALNTESFYDILEVFKNNRSFNHTVDNIASNLDAIRIDDIVATNQRRYLVEEEVMERDGTEFLNNALIDYHFEHTIGKWRSNYTCEYVKNNFIPDACLYTICIDAWYDKFKNTKKKHYKLDLTYSKMYEIIHGQAPTPQSSWGLTPLQLAHFLDKYNLIVRLIDINNNIVWENEVESKNENISPNPLHILIHNNHCYKITEKVKKLGQIFGPHYHENQLTNEKSSYSIPDYEKKKNVNWTQSYDDFKALLAADVTRKNKIDTDLFTNDVESLLFGLIKEKYEPEVYVNHATSNVTGLSVKTQAGNYRVSKVEKANITDLQFDHAQHFRDFTNWQQIVKQKVINENNKSYYSNSVMQALENYNRSAVWGYFDSTNPTNFDYILDISKDYTACMLEIPEFPLFTVFDDFMPYTAPVNQKAFYFIHVEPTEGIDLILANKRYEFVSGYALMEFPDTIKFTILYQLTPQRFQPNNLLPTIKNLYASNLPIDDKKAIPNILSGQLLKKTSHKTRSHIFLEAPEAAHYSDGRIYDLENEDTKIYVGIEQKDSRLQDGFYFIGHLIYDFARIKLFRLAQAVLKTMRQAKIIGVKTDAVFFQSAMGQQEAPKFFPLGEFQLKKDDSFESIGTLKFDKCKLPHNLIKFNPLIEDHITPHVYRPAVNHIPINDEFSNQEFSNIYNNGSFILTKALYPGCGKSTSYIDWLANSNLKAIIVTPFNALRQNLQKKTTVPVVTLNKLLGLGKDGKIKKNKEGKLIGKPIDISDIQVLMFDEIFLHPLANLTKIKRLIDRNPDKKFFATGDEYQNKPVNDKYPTPYYEFIINRLFPNQIMLKVNKRIQNEHDKQRFYALFDALKIARTKPEMIEAIKNAGIPFVKSFTDLNQNSSNVTARNKTADHVNNYFKTHEGFHPGDRVVCKTHYDKTVEGGKYKFDVNVEYTVHSLQGLESVTLQDDSNKLIPVPYSKFHEHFKLPFARTCHALQGLTIGEAINVFDLDDFFVDKHWIITALSRCTTLNIRVYEGTVQEDDIDIYLKKKINSYMQQDLKRKMPIEDDYVSVGFFKDLLQNPYCSYCACNIDRDNATLDRVDSDMPHTTTNCVVCCLHCNVSLKKH